MIDLYKDWIHHPVTQEIFEDLEERRQIYLDMILTGALEPSELHYTNRLLGQIDVFDLFLKEIIIEELIEKHKAESEVTDEEGELEDD